MYSREKKLKQRKEFMIIDKRNRNKKSNSLIKKGENLTKKLNPTQIKLLNRQKSDKSLKKENLKNKKELNKLAHLTKETLYGIQAVFPFDLFPNKVIIEKKQIVLVYRQFFWTSQEYHVLIEDMLMPIVEMAPFFASLKLELGPGAFQQNPPKIRFLKRNEAQEAKLLITGLLICNKEKIDITELKKEDIIKKAEQIGEYSD